MLLDMVCKVGVHTRILPNITQKNISFNFLFWISVLNQHKSEWNFMNGKAIYFMSFICTLNKVNLVCVIASLDNSISFFERGKKIVMRFFEWLSCNTKTFKSVSVSLIRKMDFIKVFLNVWCGLTTVIFSSLKPHSMFDWVSFNYDIRYNICLLKCGCLEQLVNTR